MYFQFFNGESLDIFKVDPFHVNKLWKNVAAPIETWHIRLIMITVACFKCSVSSVKRLWLPPWTRKILHASSLNANGGSIVNKGLIQCCWEAYYILPSKTCSTNALVFVTDQVIVKQVFGLQIKCMTLLVSNSKFFI